jgi:hypothetical protein
MNRTLLPLVGLLVSGAPLLAQIVSFPAYAPAVTTGAVGLAATQTAQLNVVNLNTANPNTTPTVQCQVQLEFWDATGKMVKTPVVISNLAPGATASMSILFTDVTNKTSPVRTEIRGVVRRTVPTPQTGVTIPGGPTVQPIAFYPLCAVATTLEIFDTTTGVTQSLTSDLHALEDFIIGPLPEAGRL